MILFSAAQRMFREVSHEEYTNYISLEQWLAVIFPWPLSDRSPVWKAVHSRL